MALVLQQNTSNNVCVCKGFLMAGIFGYYSLRSSVKCLMVSLGRMSAVILSVLFLSYPSGNTILL